MRRELNELIERLNNPSKKSLTRLYAVFLKAGVGGVLGGTIDLSYGGDGSFGFMAGAGVGSASHFWGHYADKFAKRCAGNNFDNLERQLEEDKRNVA